MLPVSLQTSMSPGFTALRRATSPLRSRPAYDSLAASSGPYWMYVIPPSCETLATQFNLVPSSMPDDVVRLELLAVGPGGILIKLANLHPHLMRSPGTDI